MQQTIASQLLREFITYRFGYAKPAGLRVFNDRLVSGDRSIKVRGFALADYEAFERWLRERGIVSSIVAFKRQGPAWNGGGRTQYRIHVCENV